jgi:hypothetical protein
MEMYTFKVKDLPKGRISPASGADCSKATCGEASTVGQERYLLDLSTRLEGSRIDNAPAR